MATHSSVLAWRIPGTGEPGGLPSMGSHRVRHDWSDLAAARGLNKNTSPFCLYNPLNLKNPSLSLQNCVCMCVCVCVCVCWKERKVYIERLLFTHIRDPWAFLSPFPIKSFGPQERMDPMIQETALISRLKWKEAVRVLSETHSVRKNYLCLEPCLSWKERMEEDSWPQRRIWVMSQQLNKHLHLSPKIKLKTKLENSGEREKRENPVFSCFPREKSEIETSSAPGQCRRCKSNKYFVLIKLNSN